MNTRVLNSLSLLTAFTLVVLLDSCSSVTVVRTREMKAVGDNVKKDVVAQLKLQTESMRKEIDSMQIENARLQKRLIAEVATLSSRVNSQADDLSSRQEEILYRLDLLVNASSKPIKRVVVDKREAGSTGAPSADSVQAAVDEDISADSELEKLYSNARADFHKSEYKLAYDEFKQAYEKAKTGDLAENALYWMGLCLTETQQADKAALVFGRILEQFPQGKKTCVVLLKLAQTAETAGKKDEQIQLLERLTAQPQCRESNEAYKAIELLDQLKK
jgi:TolA-binding protein